MKIKGERTMYLGIDVGGTHTDCPGLLVIHTRSEVSRPSTHVLPHRRACPKCLALAEDWR